MKVMLVVPPGGYLAERWSKGILMPALGIGYLAAVLEKKGYQAEIVDAHVEKFSENQLARKFLESKPDVIGLTFTTETRFEGFRVIRLAKKVLPEAMVIAGGPHVSFTTEDTLTHIHELDVIVRGEGEYPLIDIVKALEKDDDISRVTSISYRSDGKVINNEIRSFIPNLDDIPFPARHLYKMDKYNFFLDVPGKGKLRAANIMTSRGCPFNCNFCISTTNWGNRCRMRSAENVVEEIEVIMKDYGAKALWVFDDTFTTSRRRTEQICNLILERDLKISWFCEIRVDTVTKEILSLMKKAGCYCVGFGVEAGSQRIIDEVIGKKIKLEQVERVRDWCKELGIISNPFFILSHPTETMEEVRKTMDLMYTWGDKGEVSIALLHIYPGTKLEKTAHEKGILPPGFSWCEKNRKDVLTLPTAQGNVPIFLDRLTWKDLSNLLFEWAEYQNYPVLDKIPITLRNIRSFRDIKKYMTMFLIYLKRKIKNFMKKEESVIPAKAGIQKRK